MNRFQTSIYIDYFSHLTIPINAKILDIGCGGGKFLNCLSKASKNSTLYGLDHSPEMVKLARRINQKAIEQARMYITRSSMPEIPFENSTFDLVTALETVQFWPGIDLAFQEVRRVLKNNGFLLIINRFPKEGSKWWKRVQIKNEKEYIQKLKKSGFNSIATDLNFKNSWIVVEAIK